MSEPVLAVEGLGVRFPGPRGQPVTAVDGVDLAV